MKKATKARGERSDKKKAQRLAPENDIDKLPKNTAKLMKQKFFVEDNLQRIQNESPQEEEISNGTLRKYNDLRNALRGLVHLKSKEDFLTFVRKEAPKLVPDFKMGRHIEVICYKLQQVVDSPPQRLMIFLPPRSSKSVVCSKLFPAWYIGRNPSHEIMSVSHSDQLSSDFGRSVRDIVNAEDFDKMFNGVKLRSDVKAAGKWKTNKNGSYYAAGVRSQIAGRGAHVALLDDVMSEEDAISEAGRRYIKEWYPSGLRTRVMPNGSIIIINTRYHFDDICGWLLKQESENDMINKWDVVRIPAWLDEDAAELLDLPVGSSYFPEWKPAEVLQVDEQEIKASNGSRYWNALYMQNPQPDEGGIIKKKWFKWWEYEDPPECEFIIQTYDTAFSKERHADNSVIQTWGIFYSPYIDNDTGRETFQPNIILLSNMYGRYEYPELRRLAKEMYEEYEPDICIIEKKASGQSLIQDMRLNRIPILEYLPDRDKVSRVYAASPYLESGQVWLPDTDWSLSLFEEAITFPNAAHDDMVDAMTMAIMYMRDSWNLVHTDRLADDEDEDDQVYRKRKRAYWRV
jgi:predicted phage terminase large subunit-like protein